jgi:PKD repeat protein
MNRRGVSRHAALLVVLLMTMSMAAMLPSQIVTAQDNVIFGYVLEWGGAPGIHEAKVTLTKAHGLPTVDRTLIDGTYMFDDLYPGFYEIEVSMTGYFPNRTGPFRFDGDSNFRIGDFWMEKIPDKDSELTGTVLYSATEQVNDEVVEFETQTMTENITSNCSGNTCQLGEKPIIYNSYETAWINSTVYEVNLTIGTDYALDLWTGEVTILNPTIITNISVGPYSLNFTYDYAINTTYLDNKFIVAGSVVMEKNITLWPENGNYVLDLDEGRIEILSDFIFGLDELSATYRYHPVVIEGADLTLYNVTRDYVVEMTTSNSTGAFSVDSWDGAFELQVTADTYQPNVSQIQISGDQKIRVLMDLAIWVWGRVFDSQSTLGIKNARAYMFCLDDPVPKSKKLLEATIDGTSFDFYAYPGRFRLLVDADGYQADDTTIDVLPGGNQTRDIFLDPSEEETYDTNIEFVDGDWNEIIVNTTITLNRDGHLPMLGTDPMGSIFLEIDTAIGNSNGTLEDAEFDDFKYWLWERGPEFLKTSNLFLTEDMEYTLELTKNQDSTYFVNVSKDADHVWIETTAWYNTSGIELNQTDYELTLKASYDSAITINSEDRILTNYTYTINLPPDYELISNSSVNMDVMGFSDIFVDPKRGTGRGTATLTVSKSLEGVAWAIITCPMYEEDKLYFHEVDPSLDNYTVIVPAEVEICFSAEMSEDPNGPGGKISQYANFTWDFGDVSTGWGITPTHNYSDPGAAQAKYVVTVDVDEPGGNQTSASINVSVDARTPVADVWFDPEVYADQHIEEDVTFLMSANLSTDEMYEGEPGNILRWYWDFDSDGEWDAFTEEVETDFFTDPGDYTLNLTVEDWVGHKSENFTMELTVDDVAAPEAIFFILNETYALIDSPYELRDTYFNATDTIDNFSTLENLTIEWRIEGENKTGINITHIFDESGYYDVNLTVTDEAGNNATHNINLYVKIDPAIHSNLEIELGSLKFSPESPEVGTSVRVNVTIANLEVGVAAEGVQVIFYTVGTDEERQEIGGTVRLYNEQGNEILNYTIQPGEKVEAVFMWTPGRHGAYTVGANCSANNEPSVHVDSRNEIEEDVAVREAGWVTPLIIGVLVMLIFIIAIVLLLRRRFAGRMPTLKRKKPEKKEEKKKKRVKK